MALQRCAKCNHSVSFHLKGRERRTQRWGKCRAIGCTCPHWGLTKDDRKWLKSALTIEAKAELEGVTVETVMRNRERYEYRAYPAVSLGEQGGDVYFFAP